MSHVSARRWWVGLAIIAVVAIVATAMMIPLQEPQPVTQLFHASQDNNAAASAEPFRAVKEAVVATQVDLGPHGLGNLPRSMQGTTVDGRLLADASGHLIISHDVRRVFDYFLSAVGEESPERLLVRMRLYFGSELPPLAAAEAEQILFDYLAWQQAAGQLAEQPGVSEPTTLDAQRLAERLTLQQALQTEHLGPEVAEAFFGDENRYNYYTVQKLALMAQENLSPEIRTQRLQQLENSLPPEMQQAGRRLQSYQSLREQTQAMRSGGASEAELYQIRAASLGDEAAARLQDLDHQRAEWQIRMDNWLRQREALMSRSGLDASALEQQLDHQRQQYFDASEVRRVRALERIRDQSKPATN